MDVRFPDGRVIRGVPEGTSKDQVLKKANDFFEKQGQPTISIPRDKLNTPQYAEGNRISGESYMENIEGNKLEQIWNYSKSKGPSFLNIITDIISPKQTVPDYDEDGILNAVRYETEGERKTRLQESKSLARQERTIGDMPDPGSWTEVGGEVLQELSDPANLVFFSGKLLGNKVSKRFLQLTGEALVVEGTIETGERAGAGESMTQDPLDWAVRGGTALVPGTLDAAWQGVKALYSKGTQAGIERTMTKIERNYSRNLEKFIDEKGVPNKQKAFEQAMHDAGVYDLDEFAALNTKTKKGTGMVVIRGGKPIYEVVKPGQAYKEVTDITTGEKVITQQEIKPKVKYKGMQPKRVVPQKDWIYEDKALDKIVKGVERFVPEAIKDLSKGTADLFGSGYDKFIKNYSLRMYDIGKEFFYASRAYEEGVTRAVYTLNKSADEFKRAYNTIPEASQNILKKALINGDKDTYENILRQTVIKDAQGATKTLLDEYNESIRPLLDNLFDELKESATAFKHDVNYVDNFFPRFVLDPKAFDKFIGKKPALAGHFRKALDKYNKEQLKADPTFTKIEKVSDLPEDVLSDVINRMFRSPDIQGSLGQIGPEQSRTIKTIKNDDLLELYANPIEALERYIHQVAHTTETRKFMGTFGVDDLSKLDDSIGKLAAKKLRAGEITHQQAKELEELLKSRFGPGEKAASRTIQNTKNILYTTTLNDFMNAVTQVGDVFASAYVNDLRSTFVGVIQSLSGRTRISMDDLGLDRIAAEFSTTGTTAKMVDTLFKLTGFKYVDKLGKNTVINAALSRASRLAKKNPRALQKEYPGMFDEATWQSVIQDLRTGNLSENVKFMLWNKLSDVQPISLSEVPQAYLDYPNGRIFYMLKTFMIKQLNLLRSTTYDEIKKGNIQKGAVNLVKYGALIGMGNASVDQLKAAMQGHPHSELFDDKFYLQITKNFGFSEYAKEQYLDEGNLMMFITMMAAPPLTAGDRLFRDVKALAEGDGIWYSRALPFGKTIDNFFGDGIERATTRFEQEEMEDYGE